MMNRNSTDNSKDNMQQQQQQARAPGAQQIGMMPQMHQQQPNMQQQAGMKRPLYPNQMEQQAGPQQQALAQQQQQFKKPRVENAMMTPAPDESQRGSSSMADFLREVQSVASKVGTASATPFRIPNLDQMTPQQTQQFALQLLQLAQQKQAQQDAENAQKQQQGAGHASQQQQATGSAPPPQQQQFPPTGLQRTEHSLGSVGSKSSNASDVSGDTDGQLTTQLSDWLHNFFPVQQKDNGEKSSEPMAEGEIPPPPALEKSVSEALLSLATGPSKFLSGISSLFDRDTSGSSTASAPSTEKTGPQASKQAIPQKGSMMAKQTSTTLPRRGTKTIPQKQLLKLQPRPNSKRGQKPLLPLRPRPGSTTTKQLLPIQPRPSSASKVIQEQMMRGQPRKKSIQEEMSEIMKRRKKDAPAAKPGAPPMLALKRSETLRSSISLPPNKSSSEEKKSSSATKKE